MDIGLKRSLIENALSRIGVSDPAEQSVKLALERLEGLAESMRHVATGYNYRKPSDMFDRHGLYPYAQPYFEAALAVRLAPDFGQEVSPSVVAEAKSALESIHRRNALKKARKMLPPRGMPTGRRSLCGRPILSLGGSESVSTEPWSDKVINLGDTREYEHLLQIDSDDKVDSFAVTVKGDGLQLISSSRVGNLVRYKVLATKVSDDSGVTIFYHTDKARAAYVDVPFKVEARRWQ